ncbi:MAG: exodeoxyribonuclease VII large subunit [Candidatus Saccharibacteria bacterium]
MMPDGDELIVSVSEFVALLNQTLDFAYPSLVITGELANMRVSKNRWVYFDLKDAEASVKFFGTVYQLPGPLENGMLLKVRGSPHLHPLYGFSVTAQNIQPSGEGTIRRAAELLKLKLTAEGLFAPERKRSISYPPRRIGLITSRQSAAYADFIKILTARWQGIDIELVDVQVQGEPAVGQIVAAIDQFNSQAEPPDVLVLIRGGGSVDDLAAFSSEQVTRAVAGSRVPTTVAIGHEIDLSLAELAADRRASTPSNAAELLVPDRTTVLIQLADNVIQLGRHAQSAFTEAYQQIVDYKTELSFQTDQLLENESLRVQGQQLLLGALSPTAILRRGYAIIRSGGKLVRRVADLNAGAIVDVQLADGAASANISKITKA